MLPLGVTVVTFLSKVKNDSGSSSYFFAMKQESFSLSAGNLTS
jgi:hypothetical protein